MNTSETRLNTTPAMKTKKTIFASMSARQRWGIGSFIVFLALWELNTYLALVKPDLISSPGRVIVAGWRLLTDGEFYSHFYVSMLELFGGFILAVVSGLIIGALIGRYRIIGSLFDPLLMALYSTPTVALVPLFVLWFGVGVGSKVFIVFIASFFPVLMNTASGIRQVDPLLTRMSRSFGATDWQMFQKVLLPGALPAIITGIRLGWGRGIIGFVIGEMYVSLKGLGYLIRTYGNAIQTDYLFFLVLFVAAIGLIGTNLFRRLEQALSPWREEEGTR